MRILYLTTKANYGGVQTHIKQCAEYMQSRDHTVAVMAHSADNSDKGLEGEIKNLGATFYKNNFLKNTYNPIYGIWAMFRIRKVVAEFQPDIVSCHSSAAGFWGRLAIMNKVPVLFTAHGWGFSEGVNFFRGNLLKFVEKIAAPLCKKIICVSDYDKNLAIRFNIAPSDKFNTIHNGIESDIEKMVNKNKSIELKNTIPIVFTGRLSAGKYPEQLLYAFDMLSPEIQAKADVYIIGDGDKRSMLEKYIVLKNLKDRVHLFGQMSRKDVITFFSAYAHKHDFSGGIFTLISQYEGLPRSILEGMTFGFAVIATNVGGIPEEVSEDTGILIERNDVPALKTALEFLLNNEKTIKQLGENGKAKVRKDFSLNEMLTKTEKIYQSIL